MESRHAQDSFTEEDVRRGNRRLIAGAVGVALLAGGGVAAWKLHEQPSGPAYELQQEIEERESTPNPSPTESAEPYVAPSEVPTATMTISDEMLREQALEKAPLQPVPYGTPTHIRIESEKRGVIDLPVGGFEGTFTGTVTRADGQLVDIYDLVPPRDMSAYYWTERATQLGVDETERELVPTEQGYAVRYQPQVRERMEISGHSSSDPNVVMAFQGLQYVEVGDSVSITTDAGATLTYRISEKLAVDKQSAEATANSDLLTGANAEAEEEFTPLVLIACAENFETGKSVQVAVLGAKLVAAQMG